MNAARVVASLHNRMRLVTIRTMAVVVRQVPSEVLIDLRHRVLRGGFPRSAAIFDGDGEAHSVHFGAFDGDRLVGCATLHRRPFDQQTPEAWQLRGMAVDDGYRSAGVGAQLLQAVDQHVLASPLSKFLWCNGRLPAVKFYERNGWRIVSELFEIPASGPHYRLVRDFSTIDRQRSASAARATHSAPASESR